jgi:hypothetical protein
LPKEPFVQHTLRARGQYDIRLGLRILIAALRHRYQCHALAYFQRNGNLTHIPHPAFGKADPQGGIAAPDREPRRHPNLLLRLVSGNQQ